MIHDLIIVGAGIAAAAALDELRDSGWRILTLEKSRGWGGRMSTRRAGEVAFDHGTQFFTVSSADFQAVLDKHPFAVERWNVSESEGRQHYVGSPKMNALARALGAGHDPLFSTRVQSCEFQPEDGVWLVTTEQDDTFLSHRLLLTAPAPQTAEMLPTGELKSTIAAVTYAPCWTAMVAFDQRLDISPSHRSPTPTIGWAALNGSKPGRFGETWVIHGSGDWSEANLERDADAVAADLLADFQSHFKIDVPHSSLSGHRWRFARVKNPLEVELIGQSNTRVVCAGDWCLGSRVEAAFLSGLAAARQLKEWG